LLQQGDRVVGCRAADGREVRAKLTVIADGAHSRLAPERGPRRLIQAIMGWWDRVPFRPQHIEMVFDRLVSPYYGWLFPEGPSRVNIGICYSDPGLEKNARALFQAFLDKHYARRLSGAQPSGGWRGHPISYSARIEKLTSPGRITVGEAGRLTHPATAEGIYQAMSSGMRAAEALRDILTGDVTEDVSMRRYEAACRGAFARSFAGAALWRGLVASGGLDIVGGALALPPMQRLLARGLAQM
jgi:flavin-dependent dehydrogenase